MPQGPDENGWVVSLTMLIQNHDVNRYAGASIKVRAPKLPNFRKLLNPVIFWLRKPKSSLREKKREHHMVDAAEKYVKNDNHFHHKGT